jgi:hypothetical protein
MTTVTDERLASSALAFHEDCAFHPVFRTFIDGDRSGHLLVDATFAVPLTRSLRREQIDHRGRSRPRRLACILARRTVEFGAGQISAGERADTGV